MALSRMLLYITSALFASTVSAFPNTLHLAKRDDCKSTVTTTVTIAKTTIQNTTPSLTTTTSFTASPTVTAGTCQPHYRPSPECAPPWERPWTYNNYLVPNSSWAPQCQMIQFCNSADFTGQCITVPQHVRDVTCSSDYINPIGSCIRTPQVGDAWFASFHQDYGTSLQTLSVRPGFNLSCATFADEHCRAPAAHLITSGGYSNLTASNLLPWIGSLQCWPAPEAQPNPAGSATSSQHVTYTTILSTLSLSSTLPATTISVALASASSIEAALQNYFDPFQDQLLLCGNEDMTQCVAWSGNSTCDSLYPVSNFYKLETLEVAAAGFGYNCNFYSDNSCKDSFAAVEGATPTSFTASISLELSEWYFHCTLTACAPGPSASYAACTSTLVTSATTIETSLVPVEVMTAITTWVVSGSTSSMPASPSTVTSDGSTYLTTISTDTDTSSTDSSSTVTTFTTIDSSGELITTSETIPLSPSSTISFASSTVTTITTSDDSSQTVTTLQTIAVSPSSGDTSSTASPSSGVTATAPLPTDPTSTTDPLSSDTTTASTGGTSTTSTPSSTTITSSTSSTSAETDTNADTNTATPTS